MDVDHTNGRVVVHTGKDFQLRRAWSLSHLLTLKSEDPVVNYRMCVSFAEEGAVVVTGSDRGKAVVYSAGTGEVVQTLPHPGGGLVQTVTVRVLVFLLQMILLKILAGVGYQGFDPRRLCRIHS